MNTQNDIQAVHCPFVLKPLDNIGKTKKLKCSQIYT